MKIKNLTAEDIKFLKELKHELNTQDNRITANPRFYQVQHDKFVGSAYKEGEYFEALHDGESLGIYEYSKDGVEEIKKCLREYYDEDEEKLKEVEEIETYSLDNSELGLECIIGNYEHVYSNAFLTEKACKRHIEGNKHHYRNPIDYLQHAFRNPELEKVLEILSKIEIGE